MKTLHLTSFLLLLLVLLIGGLPQLLLTTNLLIFKTLSDCFYLNKIYNEAENTFQSLRLKENKFFQKNISSFLL